MVDMNKKFKEILKNKGYTIQDLMARWGKSIRAVYYICEKPTKIHWDAVNGLPDITGDNNA